MLGRSSPSAWRIAARKKLQNKNSSTVPEGIAGPVSSSAETRSELSSPPEFSQPIPALWFRTRTAILARIDEVRSSRAWTWTGATGKYLHLAQFSSMPDSPLSPPGARDSQTLIHRIISPGHGGRPSLRRNGKEFRLGRLSLEGDRADATEAKLPVIG